jgi:O-antigen/teichoic acid export membrane protein
MYAIRGSSLARNTVWMLCGQGVSFVLQAAYFIILAKKMGPTEYGVMVGAFAFTSLASQFSSLGAGTVFIRYVSGHPNRFSVYWGNILFSTVLCGSILSLILYESARFVLNPKSASIVLIAASANCVFGQITAESGRVFQAFELMRVTAFLTLLGNLLRSVSAVLMFILCQQVDAMQWSIALLSVSISAAIAAVTLVSLRWGRPAFSVALSFHHGLEGLGYSFAMSTSVVYNDLDKTFLSHYGMNLANGIYSLAYKVVDVASIPLFSLREAVLPSLFRLGRSGIERTAGRSICLLKTTLPLGLIAALAIFAVSPIIPVLLGPGFSESVTALRWLSLIPVFRSVHHMTGAALTGAGYQGLRTGAQASAAVLNLILNLWLIPVYGWRGAAWASLVTDGLLAVACWELLSVLRARVPATTECGVS